jgi:hypothetical protein
MGGHRIAPRCENTGGLRIERSNIGNSKSGSIPSTRNFSDYKLQDALPVPESPSS